MRGAGSPSTSPQPASAAVFGASRFVELPVSGPGTDAAPPASRRLHYAERGTGDVTVVFESGMGLGRTMWGLVAPAVAEHARVVVYDRAGLGLSERAGAVDAPRGLDALAADLGALLDHLGDGPFVLVGQSWGGPIVRAAAAAHPSRVAGLVLVDPTDERCALYFADSSAKRFEASAKLMPALARLGLYRALGAGPGKVLPDQARRDHRAEDFTRAAALAAAAEMRPFLDDLKRMRTAPPATDGIPTTIVSGTKPGFGEREIREAVTAAHRESAAAHPLGRLVEAAGSGHLVHLTEPRIVVDEVLRMVHGTV